MHEPKFLKKVRAAAAALRLQVDGLRLRQDFPDLVPRLLGDEHVAIMVPQDRLIRVHGDPSMQKEILVLVAKAGKGRSEHFFLITDEALEGVTDLIPSLRFVMVYVGIDLDGEEFLVLAKQPMNCKPPNSWSESLESALGKAMCEWGTIASVRKANRYSWQAADDEHPVPAWSGRTLQELLDAAFRGRTITSPDDPVLARFLNK